MALADLTLPANRLLNETGFSQEEDGKKKSTETTEMAMQRTADAQAILTR